MQLQQLFLSGFRNLRELDLIPDGGFNVLWGDNAQGKTNVLEAIYFLAHLRSFRGATNSDLVGYEAEYARMRANIRDKTTHHRLEVGLSRSARSLRVDAREGAGTAEFLGQLKTVLFAPEEVGLVKGPPGGRRSLLDRAVFLSDPGFLPRAQEYFRYLRQRNQLLRQGRGPRELEPWTEGLIQSGARLRKDRLDYLARIEKRLAEAYREMTGGREEASLCYRPDPKGSDLEEELRRQLANNREREARLGQTAAGPHRDDLLFLVDGRGLRFHGSQGQQRSFLIALKTAQAGELEERTGEPPVLLLDDLASELDRHRQGSLYAFLSAKAGQIFLTTTDPGVLKGAGAAPARLFQVCSGRVMES